MDGIELASRFSYITNSLRYCGPKEACSQFTDYINKKNLQRNKEKITSSIKRFEGLYPYLSTIAEKSNKRFLDKDVVEAYWIGNDLLDNLHDEDIRSIIYKLMQRGLPKSIGIRLIKDLPSGLKPHHSFNVMYVGVGRTAGTVETTMQNMDNCRISVGRVVGMMKNEITVETDVLRKKEKKLFLQRNEIKDAAYIPQMLPDIRKDDLVALHWGFACAKLTEKQAMNLEKYTNLTIGIMNRSN